MYVDKSGLKPGDRFGRLTAVAVAPSDTGNNRRWSFRCDCGHTAVVRVVRVKAGNTVSCGCAVRGVNQGRYRRKTLENALLSRVPEREPGQCWPWVGAIGSHGYGAFTFARVPRLAHRVSYEMFCGEIPERKDVLHNCDNRPCCNPAHLFIGDDASNVADKVSKKRHSFGERCNLSVLSKGQVQDVVRRMEVSDKSFADRFNVSTVTIARIRRGETWVLGRD